MNYTLLQETIEVLKENGKSPEDVLWVGISSKDENRPSGSWGDFEKLADFQYDNGFGGAEINADLLIVGRDWWMERHEYDGSEWWEFKTLPIKPKNQVTLRVSDLKETF